MTHPSALSSRLPGGPDLLFHAALLAVLACILPPPAVQPAAAQSASEIMSRALEAYLTRMEGVTEYTVTQEVMGETATNHFVKRETEGGPVFVHADAGGERGAPEGWGNPYRLFPVLADRARLQGEVSVGGSPTWAVEVPDFEDVDMARMTPAGIQGEFRPTQAVFYLDQESYVLRRLALSGGVARADSTLPLEIDARFSDYRRVEGMLHPFRVQITIGGMRAVMSDADRRDARRRLEQIRQQLEQMPEERRKAVEQALGPQIEQLERLEETGDVQVTVRVQELRVNQGPAGRDGGSGGGG